MTEPKPVRLQRSRKKGARLVSPNGLPIRYVGRGSFCGNPFSKPIGGVCPYELFKLYLRCQWNELVRLGVSPMALCILGLSQQEIVRRLPELRDTNLACWCKLPAPGEPDLCHASILLEIANV